MNMLFNLGQLKFRSFDESIGIEKFLLTEYKDDRTTALN